MKLFEIEEKTQYFKNIIYVTKKITAENEKEAITAENEKINNINNKYKNIQILNFTIKELKA